MNKIYRNGDWTFVPIKKDLGGKLINHKGSFVFAEGEATGHLHVMTVPNIEDMKLRKLPDGSFMVAFSKDAIVSHPEHSMKGDLTVPAGKYLLTQRREKDWFSLTTRKVID